MIDTEAIARLRAELHARVDEVLDRFAGADPSASAVVSGPLSATIRKISDVGAHDYRWPKTLEEFTHGSIFEAQFDGQTRQVRISWTKRECWGKVDRRRAIVFGFVRGDASSRPEPFAEFVESDETPPRFAAPVRLPDGRGYAKEGGTIPSALAGWDLERNDRLFTGVRDGPALRAVVDETDELSMIRFGLWIARLRGWV